MINVNTACCMVCPVYAIYSVLLGRLKPSSAPPCAPIDAVADGVVWQGGAHLALGILIRRALRAKLARWAVGGAPGRAGGGANWGERSRGTGRAYFVQHVEARVAVAQGRAGGEVVDGALGGVVGAVGERRAAGAHRVELARAGGSDLAVGARGGVALQAP